MISDTVDEYEDSKIRAFMGSQFIVMLTAEFGHISQFVPWQQALQQSVPAMDAHNTGYTFNIAP